MVGQIVHAPTDESPFRDAFARIRDELEVPTAFPADVLEEADAAVRAGPRDSAGGRRRDARDVPFVTIDPAGSRDLDQAFHAERRPGGGFRVHYAIADVAAFVAAGGAIDRESLRRGVTLYLPDGRAPMLPEVLCEGAASLLADEDRVAVVWTIDLDTDGAATSTRVERAMIRNRAALSFTDVQQQLDAGTADEPLALLREIGTLRRDLESARGGISLDLPAQEVEVTEGGYTLIYRAPLPVETWNAQISLLTGMEAAKLMIGAHVGILRTLPPPQSPQITRLRRHAGALHIGWPKGMSWGALASRLDRSRPPDAAFLIQATHVLRGAGYAVLDAKNTADPAVVPVHAGVAAPYAHVTAPLRRLGDRYANEIVLAACAGTTPPEWSTAALDEVATAMQAANRHSAQIERAVIDAVECVLLLPHVGERFEAVVVDRNERGAIVQLTRPAVVAEVPSDAALGDRLDVRLEAVDPVARRLQFRAVSP